MIDPLFHPLSVQDVSRGTKVLDQKILGDVTSNVYTTKEKIKKLQAKHQHQPAKESQSHTIPREPAIQLNQQTQFIDNNSTGRPSVLLNPSSISDQERGVCEAAQRVVWVV